MLCKFLPLFKLSLSFFTFIQLSFSFSLHDQTLIDLQEKSSSYFTAETAGWESTFPYNHEDMTISFCQDFPLLGGYLTNDGDGGAYLQREYIDLPHHNQIEFSLVLWIEGGWDIVAQDLFKFAFDLEPLQAINIKRYENEQVGASCRSNEDINIFKVHGIANHNGSSLIFQIKTQPEVLEQNTAFGIREINFTFTQESNQKQLDVTSPSSQTPHLRNLVELSSTSHPTERMVQSITCDYTCLTCYGTTSNDCLSCPSNRFLRVLGTGVSFCAPLFYPQFKDFVEYVVLVPPDIPEKPSLSVLVNSMQYVRYLNMQLPPSLARLAIGKGRAILSLRYGMHMPNSMKEAFVRYPLPYVFQRHDYYSSFLINYWQEITSIGIIIAAVLVFMVCEKICKMAKWRIAGTVFEALRVMTRCNLILVLLVTSFPDIILFGSFEFRTFFHSFESGLTYVSFFFFIFVLVVITSLFGLLVIIAMRSKHAMNFGFQEQTFFGKTREEFQVLYTSFNWKNIIGRLFMMVYMVRLGLPMIFASYLYVSPMAQSVIQLLISIAILAIIGYFRPFKKMINMIQITLFETLVFGMNICMLIVTIMSVYGVPQGDSFETLGYVIVVGNVLINLLLLIFLVIKVILEVRIILSLKHLTTELKIIAWFQLLFLILQQGGFGFETISEGPASDFQDQFSEYATSPSLNNTTNMVLQTSMQIPTHKRGAIMPLPNPTPTPTESKPADDNSYINSIEMRDSPHYGSPRVNYRNNYRNNVGQSKHLSARSQRGTSGLKSSLRDPGSPTKGIRKTKTGTRPGDTTFTVSMNLTENPILYEDGIGHQPRVSFTQRDPSQSSEDPAVVSYGDWTTKRGSKNKLLDLYYSMRNTSGKLASNGRTRKAELDTTPIHLRSSSKIVPWVI